MHPFRSLRLFTVCALLPALALAGCSWLPRWAGGGEPGATVVQPAAQDNLVVVQYRQGPRSFAAQTANEAVGVRMVQTLGVIDGALVEPPAGMSAEEAAARLREQAGVVNAEPQRAR
ncbi:hypothetical protein FOZ76_02060 [Verticiella sediminum]|uniref:Fervidolysin-like N-terminal prodomain domain-containing protein n=1 Tax=Verticiella sediminum TaxID=1247510 RepID=A0A556B050_9BURK|nr:hypothetical protein [Verticiella sediminum]TSH98558.1 hypothetical protein FOZ76_02060 [Verticiella sediminum]